MTALLLRGSKTILSLQLGQCSLLMLQETFKPYDVQDSETSNEFDNDKQATLV